MIQALALIMFGNYGFLAFILDFFDPSIHGSTARTFTCQTSKQEGLCSAKRTK
jgi:hypothetical protein